MTTDNVDRPDGLRRAFKHELTASRRRALPDTRNSDALESSTEHPDAISPPTSLSEGLRHRPISRRRPVTPGLRLCARLTPRGFISLLSLGTAG